jgi:DNA-binding winged helix-turn-helix (wHTH) protein
MGVLLCLAKHRGETLSKEQLFQAVWPNIVVTEDVLKRCIAELRRAFSCRCGTILSGHLGRLL